MIKPLPFAYHDLMTVYQPEMAKIALSFHGLAEVPGIGKSNPVILSWAKEMGHTIEQFYSDDDTAWCALYMSVCAKRAGYQPPQGFNSIRARSFEKWGEPVHIAGLWDVLVFSRTGGYHVGIYVGEDKTCYHVLGGNQGNMVSIRRLEKERCIAKRRPPYGGEAPKCVKPVIRSGSGTISQNEA